MTDQHVNEITLGNGIVMKEFFLTPGESAPVPEETGQKTEKSAEMDKLVQRYHAEDFLEVNGRRIPAIFDGRYALSDIRMETIEGMWRPSGRFIRAVDARRERALVSLLKKGGNDGKNVSVRDWHITESGLTLVGQAINYTQFKVTDAAQDEPLHPDDSTFPEGATLRDYVVVNGRESRKGTDTLANLLGAAFVVRAKGQDEQDYFVLGRRQKGRTTDGGELSVIGATPMWDERYFGMEQRSVDFAGYMKSLAIDEHREELSLREDEIDVGRNVFFLRTLVRAFDPVYTVDVDPQLSVESITERCYGNPEVLKEHDRLYALPRTDATLQGLMNTSQGYSVGLVTLAGLHLAVRNQRSP